MSLILDALRKLEREREASGRGFLVLAPTAWPAVRARGLRFALVALLAGALAGSAAWAAWTLLAGRRAPRAAAPVAAAATPSTPTTAPAAEQALPPPIWAASPAAPAKALPAPGAPAVSASPAPAAAAPQEPAALRLEAISSQDGQPVAVINGQLVRKGETIGGALVVAIGADSVELEVEGKRRRLGF